MRTNGDPRTVIERDTGSENALPAGSMPSRYIPLSTAYARVLTATAEDGVNLRPYFLGALSRGDLDALISGQGAFLSVPRGLWERVQAKLTLSHDKDAAFYAAESARRLFEKFQVDMPGGLPDGMLLVAEHAFAQWLGHVRSAERETKREGSEREVEQILRALITADEITSVTTKQQVRAMVRSRAAGHVPEKRFLRVWAQVTTARGRQDLRRPGRKPKLQRQ